MGAYGYMDAAVPGLIAAGRPIRTETGIAKEIIDFGAPVMGYPKIPDLVYNAHRDQATLTLSADLVTSNVYTVTINDVEIAETFDTDHATTMTALIAAINADATLIAAGISAAPGSTNRIVVVKGKGLDVTAAGAVTLGASQATVTVAYTTWAKFLGVAAFTQTATASTGAGNSAYQIGDAVNVLTQGSIWVATESDAEDKLSAYAIFAPGATQRKFTASSSGTYDIGGYFRSSRDNGLSILEVRGLK